MTFFRIVTTVIALTFQTTAPLIAQSDDIPPIIPVEKFATLPSMQQMQLSPNGEYLAYLTPIKGRMHALVHPINDTGALRIVVPVKDADVSSVRWANDDRLLVAYKFTGNSWGSKYKQSAFFSFNRDITEYIDMAKASHDLRVQGYKTSIAQFKDDVIDALLDDPKHILLNIDSDRDGKSEVRRVNVTTGKFSTIQKGRRSIQNWMVDKQHNVRYGYGYENNKFKIVYRDPSSKKFIELTKTDWYVKDEIRPIEFTEDPRIAYALMPNDDGRQILIKFNIPEARIVETVFEHPEVDVSGLAHDPETGEVIGYRYYDDMPRTHFINKFYEKLFSILAKWLPGGSHAVIGRNSTKKLYLIEHYSDIDYGTIYVLDLKSKRLSKLGATMPLDAKHMASVNKEVITARDGVKIHTYFTKPKGRDAKNLPTIILPHGGPHARDNAYFDYWAQFLANRGYMVVQPNFRGSTGYGKKFKKMGYNQWGGKMQDDVTDVTKWAIDSGLADPSRICIVGASYGGYAALMGAVKEPDLYKCAVSINGVANIPDLKSFERGFIGGRVWIKKITPTDKSNKDISPYHQAKSITAPTLIIHVKDDPVVPYAQGKDIYKRLKRLKKDVEFVRIKTADHFLDTAEARVTTLTALEKFLQKHIGD